MLQNFLPLRLSSGFLDGGFYVTPTVFNGQQTTVLLADGVTYVTVAFFWSPLAKMNKPYAQVTLEQERNKVYRTWPAYMDHATCTGPLFAQMWETNMQLMNIKSESQTFYDQVLLQRTGNDQSTLVTLPLDYDDTEALILENGGLYGEGFVPVTPSEIAVELADLEFVSGRGMGATFTVLEIDEVRYIHQQGAANTVWTIQHDLGSFPRVTAKESAVSLLGRVDHVDANNLTITFGVARAGEAQLGF